MNIVSIGIPLNIENIDTDQIIPANYLKQTSKTGYGKHLFQHMRYDESGEEKPDFILNSPVYRSAEILIAGHNFGCGSSREHAAWALADYGFKAIISSGFADIFKGNAYNNNILPIELPAEDISSILQLLDQSPETLIQIDLQNQTVNVGNGIIQLNFAIDSFKKECLLSQLDETTYLVQLRDEITAFEQQYKQTNA